MSALPIVLRSASEVGRVVRARRGELKLSQGEVACASGVNQSRIGQLEGGSGTVPLRAALMVVGAVGLELELRYRGDAVPVARVMLKVPYGVVFDVRRGLHSVLGHVTESISATVMLPGREKHPEWYEQDREHFEQTCALLDMIGWADPPQPSIVQVPLPEYRWALTEALPVALNTADEDVEALEHDERQRALRGEAPRRAQTIERARALREFAAVVEDQISLLDAQEEAST